LWSKPESDAPVQNQNIGNDLLSQLDPKDPLILLSRAIDWSVFETEFARYYSPDTGRPAIPIRHLVGLLLLKSLQVDGDMRRYIGTWFEFISQDFERPLLVEDPYSLPCYGCRPRVLGGLLLYQTLG
jgi:hypothetical protein